MSSDFTVPIVGISLKPHPNADTLSIVSIKGYQVVVKTEEWKGKIVGVWVPPDCVVPDTPPFKFLGTHRRVRTRRFRGEWSHGFLLPLSDIGIDKKEEKRLTFGYLYGAKNDFSKALGIVPYEPPSSRYEGPSTRQRSLWQRLISLFRELKDRPRGRFPYYDIQHFRRNPEAIRPGDHVFVTEKVHGANALYTYRKPWIGKGRIYARSRTVWGMRGWWQVALSPKLMRFLKDHPGWAVYGEVYGPGVQELDYGVSMPHFVAFDIWTGTNWMPKLLALQHLARYGVKTVPLLYRNKLPEKQYEEALKSLTEHLERMAIQDSFLAGKPQMREGVVITAERPGGRTQLKLVSDRYLEKR